MLTLSAPPCRRINKTVLIKKVRFAMSRVLSQNRSGFISLMAMVVAIIMFIIGIALLTLGFNRRLFSIRANQQIAARGAADYGLTKAVHEMNLRLPTVTAPYPAESSVQVPGSNAGSNATSTYSYAVTKDSGIYYVQASGTCGSTTKTVTCELRLKSVFEYAILTKNNLDIGSVSTVNCDNCGDVPLKIGTTNNPNTTAQITLKPNSTVDGDILLGQGGIPSLVVGAGATYHNIYAVATDYDLPQPALPANFVTSATTITISSSSAINTAGKYICSTIDLKNGGTLDVNANVELYVTGAITLKNGADIKLAAGKKLTIYLAGAFDGYYGAGFNDGGDPTLLTIIGLGSSDIIIKNSDAFCGTVYAPNANVHLYNSAKVYGSIIANNYKQDNSALFTYDANLRQVTDASLARFVPNHWREQ
jgi:hypothetical protein